jgi:diketogulonate reductase-like aldo/keto reductase
MFCMSFTLNSTAKLNNGIQIPRLGLGVYQIPPGKSTVKAVKYALKIGYKHFDTAMIYGNESDVGTALKEKEKISLSLQRSGTAIKDTIPL